MKNTGISVEGGVTKCASEIHCDPPHLCEKAIAYFIHAGKIRLWFEGKYLKNIDLIFKNK